MDIVRRKLMSVTIGTYWVKRVGCFWELVATHGGSTVLGKLVIRTA